MLLIPVITIVGKSDSGKTTFLEGLVRELVARGLKVATVKHHAHETDIDQPGKDSWRHARAGSTTAMIASPTQFALVSRVEKELTLPEIARVAQDAGNDILIAEGFKRQSINPVEISRHARSDEIISDPADLFALVTDNPDIDAPGVPRFPLDGFSAVADHILDTLAKEASDG